MRKGIITLLIIFVMLTGIIIFLTIVEPEYAYVPPNEKVVNSEDKDLNKFHQVSFIQNEDQDKLIEKGKGFFYQDTFGNEVFFTDIMGMFDGAFSFPTITKAIIKLNGKGTDNLMVESAQKVKIGDRIIEKGELIETGLDVPKGAYVPLGVKFKYDEGNIKAGISCALCHATVNQSGKVVQGISNNDLDIGLMLALATNTASYFTHTEMESIKQFIKDENRVIENSKGDIEALPNMEQLEEFVDREVMKWPKGSIDTTIDFKNNPIQTIDVFTKGDQPYGWSGQGQIGPFKGLSAAINNAHSQNMDSVSQTAISNEVLNIDKELYLAILLQNAANEKYRYDPKTGVKPSEFFSKVDPTPGADGVNKLIPSSTYPKASYMTSVGLFSSSDGLRAWEQQNAMSAFMNTLEPPKTGLKATSTTSRAEGRIVFENAGCISCHGGTYLTNNKVIPSEEIKTDNSRAMGFKKLENFFTTPTIYDPETPVPLPENPIIKEVPMTKEQEQQLRLGWAFGGSEGGYKTISLYGLYWSAPYLHDGGVAVGPNIEKDIGVPGTIFKGIKPSARNSLLAMIDSNLRKKVINENKKNEKLRTAHVSGKGHEYWVDSSTGFSKEEQQALIDYLLKVTD
ncbi:cytochrome c551/c552 [Metabacillus crassostreae]|uniref:electron transport protein n=1 Tax=Metabacillus crassostreae TaxID=929098 RepID=UPI001EF7E445|nr:electron transport protein [Metabacillus crassostreae]MBM7602212.1 cytochrome c551/c552 [Metabacillus crassostreae]